MKHKLVLIVATLVFVAGGAVAQTSSNQTVQDNDSLSTVIVATNSNYPDALTASSASEKQGIPVLITNPDNLSSSTSQFIEENNVSRVVIVGGDAVVSEQVESQAENLGAETVRLWSENASGTSVEVANYFWEDGYDSATVVQTSVYENHDSGYSLTAAAANTAEGEPLLISREGDLSDDVLNELESRNIQEVELYTTNASNSREQLENLGIDVTVNEGDVDDIQNQVYNEISSSPENKTLVTVAGEEFENGLPAYAVPTPTTYIVNAENTEGYAQFINQSDFSRTMVIGDEQLSNTLVEQARSANMTAASFNQGNAVETAVSLAQNTIDAWINLQNERYITGQNDTEMNETLNQTNNQTANMTGNTTGNVTGNLTENETGNVTGNVSDQNITQYNATVGANQTENNTTDNTTDNSTDNSTDNTTSVNVSDINITTEGNKVVAEVSYNTSGDSLSEIKNVTQEDGQITFVFGLNPDENDFESDRERMVRSYDMRNSIEVEQGQNYQVTARVDVDNETVEQTEKSVNTSAAET